MTQHLRQLPQPDPVLRLDPDRQEQRERAFELWAFAHRRSCPKVAAALALPERTVRDWVTRYGWEAERARRLAELVPHLASQVVEDTVMALVNSLRYAQLASELPTDDEGNACTHVVVDQAGKTHYLTGPTKERTELAKLSLQLADALAGDQGLAGLLGAMRGTHGATSLAGLTAPPTEHQTAAELLAQVQAERDAVRFDR